ncbi:transcriptional regulator [Saccharomonospora marina XMU15]|uniref:Transcriptional regulator n=1 Tax=Saccharomonospora marina XMU15 TaxID=882083 RepID=H5X9J1_9PSEU|nr:MarR family transcriptional regulator [Saccharomonospora marina]EHR50356.1 transcriptional regulator [Saccharomonospora marina XMU15]
MPHAVPSGRVGFLLARAGGRAIRNLNRALEPFGLRSRHYTVLSASAEQGGLSQRELGEVLGVDPSAVVSLVDDLERAGLVRRDSHPDDRRTRVVVVTEAGRSTLDTTRELARGVDDELLAGLSEDERRTLERLLLRLAS